mgnify:CR=1 FL=1
MAQNQLQNQYMYGPQTSAFETAGTSTTVLGRVQQFTGRRENRFIYDAGMGEGFNDVATYLGTYECGGNVVFNPVDFDFLKHWIGPKSGSGTAGSPYVLTEVNVIGFTSSDIQVFTFEDANVTEATNEVVKYIGCVGDAFTLSGNIGSKLVCNATFLARHTVSSTSATAYTPTTANAFTMLAGVWSFGSTPSALSGVQSFSLSYRNNLNGPSNRDIDSRFIARPVLGIKKYFFTLDIKMTSALATAIIDAHYSNTNSPNTGASAANPTADLEFKIALTTGNKLCTLWVDQCAVESIVASKDIGGGLVILRVAGYARLGKDSTPIKWWSI